MEIFLGICSIEYRLTLSIQSNIMIYFEILNKNSIDSELTADLLWAFTQKQSSKADEQSVVYGDIPCVVEKQKVGLQIRNWNILTDEMLETIAKCVVKAFPKIEFDYKLICLQKNSDEEKIRLTTDVDALRESLNNHLC